MVIVLLSMKIAQALTLTTLVVLSLLPAAGQEQEPAPLVRSNSQLVILDVVVTDKSGKPVRNLTQDHFTVLENGVPQKITSFESPDTIAASPDNAPRTIILLDQLNIQFSDLSYARDRVMRFIEQNHLENQQTALMQVSPHGLAMIQDFTRDPKSLKDKLKHLHQVLANSTDGYVDPGKIPDYAQKSLGALTEIARASGGSASSLNVIWVTSFSGLVEMSSGDNTKDAALRNVLNLLIRSRVRLYTIDPAGVVLFSAPAKMGTPGRGDARNGMNSSAEQALGPSNGDQHSADVLMSHLTGLMGGVSYYGRNDVDQALSEAVVDIASAYSLSYSPSNTDFNGGFRKIEIQTNIEGASARTRRGYYALPDEPHPDPQMKEVKLKTALASPLNYGGYNLTCPLNYDPSKGRASGKLTVTPKSDTKAMDQTRQIIRAEALSENGKVVTSWAWDVTWKNPWTNRAVTAAFDKVLPSEVRRLRFLISDPAAERIGTCDYRLP